MHVLFVHQNFPAQFGHVAEYLVRQKGFRCTFASQKSPGIWEGVERIQYHVKSGATEKTHYCSRTFIYLTVPFVLSWSLMNALACGTTVLASNTAPVLDMIEDGKNGLLADFFDIEGLAERASRVLDAPDDYKALGAAGVELIRDKYSLEVCLPKMLTLYEGLTRNHR